MFIQIDVLVINLINEALADLNAVYKIFIKGGVVLIKNCNIKFITIDLIKNGKKSR